jgi:SAM-dependent methyltransferase
MIDAAQWLDDWAEAVPGLFRVDRGHWRSADIGEVSFPPGAHTTLASIESESRWFAHRNRLFAATIGRFPPAGPIVDVGGGNGFVSMGLSANGIPAIVVEPGSEGAATSVSRGLPTVHAAYESLKIPDGSLTGVGMFDVLEHIEFDLQALQSIHAALQVGGRLYVAVPAHQWLWSPVDKLSGHFRRYSRKTLETAIRRAGFKVEYATYYFSPLVPAILIGRTLSSRLGAGDQSKTKLPDPETSRREHQLGGAVYAPLREPLFHAETESVKAGRSFPFGSSCLVVAKKA